MKILDGREVYNVVKSDLIDKDFSWLNLAKGININEFMTAGYELSTGASYLCINLRALNFYEKYHREQLIDFFSDYLKLVLFKKGYLGFIEVHFHISDKWFDNYASLVKKTTISV